MDYGIFYAIVAGLVGCILGSFVGASVWRLRARQLRQDQEAGDKVRKSDMSEVANLQKAPLNKDRSVCLHCGHQLSWYDLIPLASWLSLKGKCRYCHKSIGWFEPLIELSLGTFFVISYLFWPYPLDGLVSLTQLGVWLLAGVGLAVLFVYDLRWYILPNVIVFPLIFLGAVNSLVVLIDNQLAPSAALSILYGCIILSGLYYLIYILSRYRWVGFGDVKLGLALALLLADWRLSLLSLFMANLIGTVIYLPGMVRGKMDRQAQIPFGPLLIGGWAIAGLFGNAIVDWYFSIALGTL